MFNRPLNDINIFQKDILHLIFSKVKVNFMWPIKVQFALKY